MGHFFTHIYVLNTIGYLWFLFVGKAIWKIDFAFLRYEGPSDYLHLCVQIGWFFVLTLAMLPAGVIMLITSKKLKNTWTYKEYLESLLVAGILSLMYFLGGTLVFGCIGLLIGIFSHDAANAFIEFLRS